MIGKPNKKLQWSKSALDSCDVNSGTGHACNLIKGHKPKKHSCLCGREWYGNFET